MPAKLGETPDYDELVVFKPAQILPRYIYYYHSVVGASEQLAPNRLCTVWLEASPAPSVNRMLTLLRESHPLLHLVMLGSVSELSVWVSNHPETLARSLRLVCGSDVPLEAAAQAVKLLSDRKATKLFVLFTGAQPPPGLVNGKTALASTDPMRAAEFVIHMWPARNG